MKRDCIIVTIRRNVKRKIFIEDIVYCKAKNTSTSIKLRNDISFWISKPLKEIQKELSNYLFCRINRSYLINMNYAIEIQKNGHATIKLVENSVFRISKNQKKLIEECFLKQAKVDLLIEKGISHIEKAPSQGEKGVSHI